mgnify:CR=1 FL=1
MRVIISYANCQLHFFANLLGKLLHTRVCTQKFHNFKLKILIFLLLQINLRLISRNNPSSRYNSRFYLLISTDTKKEFEQIFCFFNPLIFNAMTCSCGESLHFETLEAVTVMLRQKRVF